MVKVALFVQLEAKKGKEQEVEKFLRDALPTVQQEPDTTAWFAMRMGPSKFGIFDAFPDDAGRQEHLSGRVAAALMAKAPELFAQPPKIENIDVLADKLPSKPSGVQSRAVRKPCLLRAGFTTADLGPKIRRSREGH